MERRQITFPAPHQRREGRIPLQPLPRLRPLRRIEGAKHRFGGEQLVTGHAGRRRWAAISWTLRASHARTPESGVSK